MYFPVIPKIGDLKNVPDSQHFGDKPKKNSLSHLSISCFNNTFPSLITMLHKIAIQQFPEYVMRRDSHSRAFKQLGSAFDLKHQPESLLLQLLIFRLVEV